MSLKDENFVESYFKEQWNFSPRVFLEQLEAFDWTKLTNVNEAVMKMLALGRDQAKIMWGGDGVIFIITLIQYLHMKKCMIMKTTVRNQQNLLDFF